MHEMQTIATDVSVCLSICLSPRFTVENSDGRVDVMFGVKTLGGTRNIVLDGGPDHS